MPYKIRSRFAVLAIITAASLIPAACEREAREGEFEVRGAPLGSEHNPGGADTLTTDTATVPR